jgi:hypothetical protein
MALNTLRFGLPGREQRLAGCMCWEGQSPWKEQDRNRSRSKSNSTIAAFPLLRCSRPDKPGRKALHPHLMQVACQLLAPLGQAQRKPNSSVKRPPSKQVSTVIDAMILCLLAFLEYCLVEKICGQKRSSKARFHRGKLGRDGADAVLSSPFKVKISQLTAVDRQVPHR